MAKDHPGYNPGVSTQYAGNNTAYAGMNKDDPGRDICIKKIMLYRDVSPG